MVEFDRIKLILKWQYRLLIFDIEYIIAGG